MSALVATTGGATAAVAATATPVPASLLTVRLNGSVVNGVAANLPLTQDIAFGTSYGICCTDGVATSKLFSSGWSIATLITAAGASPSAIRSVTIERPDAATDVTLLPADFDPATAGGLDFPASACAPATPDAAGTSCPAFIYTRDTGLDESLSFFRPERAVPPADDNAADWIQSPVGGGLTIDISGPHLAVTAAADHTKVRVGAPVRFTASASSAIAGETLDYSWSLSDGTTLSGADVTHAFADPGAYQAIAKVSGSSGSAGASAPITIVVAKKAGTAGPGGATSTTLPPTSGGDRGGPSPTPPTTLTTQSVTPSGQAAGPTGRETASKAAPAAGTHRSPPSTSKPPAAGPPQSGTAGETLVRGDLLADSSGRTSASISADGSPEAKRATGAGGTHVSGTNHRWWSAVLGVGVVLSLFLFGAASERGRRGARLTAGSAR